MHCCFRSRMSAPASSQTVQYIQHTQKKNWEETKRVQIFCHVCGIAKSLLLSKLSLKSFDCVASHPGKFASRVDSQHHVDVNEHALFCTLKRCTLMRWSLHYKAYASENEAAKTLQVTTSIFLEQRAGMA